MFKKQSCGKLSQRTVSFRWLSLPHDCFLNMGSPPHFLEENGVRELRKSRRRRRRKSDNTDEEENENEEEKEEEDEIASSEEWREVYTQTRGAARGRRITTVP